MVKQLQFLHDIYTKTDEAGGFLGYKSEQLERDLKSHIKKTEKDVDDFNQRLTLIQLAQKDILAAIGGAQKDTIAVIQLAQKDILAANQVSCKFVPGRNNIKT